eukprot:TRINITY_DN2804_c0_g1_i1.p2 TRINITY_DN2804_c0_g1~~TRINITY_DN2804_c0_g1_i1.p2  ORF type:complete len:360 (+),score=63.23 TRINITY_DN2804_c0_g1_i1:1188-2267(+)
MEKALLLVFVAIVAFASGVHQKVLLTEAVSDGAVCLDGTPGAYYFRKGTGDGANKWYVHHQGGGWCNSISNCYQRSQTDLGSSKGYPDTKNIDYSYFSTDPKVNPQFHNWNSVYLAYCDGGSFSGNNETVSTFQGHNLYFRGFRVLSAAVSSLLTKQGLNHATDVVVSGCSAGGLATFLHVDWWKSILPRTAKVVGMPDSGFFLDYETSRNYHGMMVWVFEQMNSTAGLNQRCISAHQATKDTWKCIFAEHTSPFIQTPMFPLQSQFDSWQLDNILGNNTDVALVNKFGTILLDRVTKSLLDRAQNSIWLHSCSDHCGGWGNIHIEGHVMATAFQQWYDGSLHRYFQGKPFPCTECCKN